MSDKAKSFFVKYSVWFILIFAFLLRCSGIWYGLPYIYSPDPGSPDEQYIMMPALNILFTGDLNPHWAGYPAHIIIYLLAFLLSITKLFLSVCFRNIVYYVAFSYFIGRLVMVILGSITVYLVYAIGKKLFNASVGILASFCLAIAPLHVLHSKIVRPDIPTTLMILIALYCLYAYDENKRDKNILIYCYLFAGFAIAVKYTSGIIIVPILIYCLIMDHEEKKICTFGYIADFLKLNTNASRALFYMFFAFFVTSPFVFLDFNQTLMNFSIETRSACIGQERLNGIQNHLWYIKGVLINGIGGLFFTVLALLGLILTMIKKSYRNYILLLFPILYYIAMSGFGKLRFYRWLIPILPFEALLFGVGAYAVYRYIATSNLPKRYKYLIAALCIFVTTAASLPAIGSDIREDILLTKKDTRTIAKEWVENNIPEGARIAVEEDTPQLLILSKKRFCLFPAGAAIVNKPVEFYTKNNIDYVILTRNLKDLVYKEPVRYRIPIERYERLAKEAELVRIFDYKENPGPVLEIYRLKR